MNSHQFEELVTWSLQMELFVGMNPGHLWEGRRWRRLKDGDVVSFP